jgi:hypothetical protein
LQPLGAFPDNRDVACLVQNVVDLLVPTGQGTRDLFPAVECVPEELFPSLEGVPDITEKLFEGHWFY